MNDMAYIVSRTLEHKIAIAENNNQNTLLVTLDALKEIIASLKEQEAEWLEVDDKHDAFDCSNCGAIAGRKSLYCPGCGAKMKNGTRAMSGR